MTFDGKRCYEAKEMKFNLFVSESHTVSDLPIILEQSKKNFITENDTVGDYIGRRKREKDL